MSEKTQTSFQKKNTCQGHTFSFNSFFNISLTLSIVVKRLFLLIPVFFAGLETKSNSPTLRAYKTVLDEMVHDVTDKIDALEQIND